jgi:hypothetical protein
LLAVRTGEETDSTLYPVLGARRGLVALEVGDGEPLRLRAKGLTVADRTAGRHKALVGLRDVHLQLVLTDARLVLACEGFDMGGGWVGWAPGAVAVAPAGEGPGPWRRRQRVLVGQVRHPWLRAAGFRPRTRWFADEQLRLAVTTRHATGERELLVDLELPRDVSSEELCRALVSRAAAHRLTRTPCREPDRAALEALLDPPRLTPPGRHSFAVHHFPRYYLVGGHRVDSEGRGAALALASADNQHRPAVEPA